MRFYSVLWYVLLHFPCWQLGSSFPLSVESVTLIHLLLSFPNFIAIIFIIIFLCHFKFFVFKHYLTLILVRFQEEIKLKAVFNLPFFFKHQKSWALKFLFSTAGNSNLLPEYTLEHISFYHFYQGVQSRIWFYRSKFVLSVRESSILSLIVYLLYFTFWNPFINGVLPPTNKKNIYKWCLSLVGLL